MKKKLLLADDSVTIQKVVQITFSHDDYELTVVDNGDIAYEKARLQRPDIILADVFMPGKNGYELCAAVKNDPSLSTVPVLLLTGTFEPFDEAKAKSAGADRWIAKPFESQALIACVEELLKQAVQAPVISPPVFIPTPAPVPTPVSPPAPVEAVAFTPPELTSALPDDIWGEEFATESTFASGEQPAADAFAATTQDDLWDVSGFETDAPLISAAGTEDDDLWGGSFETTQVSEPIVPAATAVVEDAWGNDDFSMSFATAADESAVADFLSTGDAIPLADEVEILDEIDLLEPVAETSPEIDLDDAFATEDFSFAEESLQAEVVEAPSVFVAPVPVAPVATPLPLPVMNVVPQEVAAPPVATESATSVATLSDAQLEVIVEKVAGVVISRLAGTLLEKIAWEVVPDLAETMIKEELRKIREAVAAD